MSNPFATTAPAPKTAPVAPVQQFAAPAPQQFAAPAPQQFAAPAPQQFAAPAPQQFAAPVAPQQFAAPVAPTAPTDEKPKKDRKKPNRQMTTDERKYVIENYATRTTSDMAKELNLTRQQVYRTVHEARAKINERIEKATAIGDMASVQKLQNYMADKLPEKPWGGGPGSGSPKGSSVDSVLDALLGM